METPSQPRQPWVSALDHAGWGQLADRVIHGLSHDLTGRVSAMVGLSYVLESSADDSSSILPLLNEELEQMEETIRLLRLLPDDSVEAEVLAPGEILPDLVRMVLAQRGLENVEIRIQGLPRAPAVRIDRSFFIRSMVMLLTAAAEEAVLRGTNLVEVKAGEKEDGLILEARPLPHREDPGSERETLLPRRLLPRDRVMIWMNAMIEEGGVAQERVDEGGIGVVQLALPSPSSFSS